MTIGVAREIAVVGPTASGKSDLALLIARTVRDRLGLASEIVCVDAMTVYRGLDIGTAKPSSLDRTEFVHHGLDIAEPEESVTMVDLARTCRVALADIRSRGAVGIVVGGTGLHLRAVIDGLTPPGEWPEVRADLEARIAHLPSTVEDLYRQLCELDPIAAARTEPANARRIVRALEVCIGSGKAFSSFGPGLSEYPAGGMPQIAIGCERPVLAARIGARVEAQLSAGWLEEVRAVWDRLGPTACQVIGYAELHEHLHGRLTLTAATHAIVLRTRQFAVRQERWFRRDPRIQWYSPNDLDDVVASVVRDMAG